MTWMLHRSSFCGMLLAAAVALTSLMNAAAMQTGDRGMARWTSRLEALRPSAPLEYFELAEEVADAAAQPEQRELAKHLFALAGVLDAEKLGRSACLALADLEQDDIAKRRLLALGSLLGSAAGDGGALQDRAALWSPSGGTPPAAALAVSHAMAYYRRGQGTRAMDALKKPGAMELLGQFERALPGGLNRFLEDCKHYKGQARPMISSGDLVLMLQLESALLSGNDRPWSSDLLITGGRPLVEVDPERLGETLGVDASKPLYRNGRWVER